MIICEVIDHIDCCDVVGIVISFFGWSHFHFCLLICCLPSQLTMLNRIKKSKQTGWQSKRKLTQTQQKTPKMLRSNVEPRRRASVWMSGQPTGYINVVTLRLPSYKSASIHPRWIVRRQGLDWHQAVTAGFTCDKAMREVQWSNRRVVH